MWFVAGDVWVEGGGRGSEGCRFEDGQVGWLGGGG